MSYERRNVVRVINMQGGRHSSEAAEPRDDGVGGDANKGEDSMGMALGIYPKGSTLLESRKKGGEERRERERGAGGGGRNGGYG